MVFLLLLISSCSNADQEQSSMNDAESNLMEDSVTEAGAVESTEMEVTKEAQIAEQDTTEIESQDRMMIYQGNIVIEVSDYHQAANAIQAEAIEIGGYVVESSYFESGQGQLDGTMTIRVPEQYFHSFLGSVAESDGKVLEQFTQGNDVTEEFVDLDARLKSKRVVEERLLGFMEQADSTENLLKISNELAAVQEEMEQLMGRIQFLENQVDFSTITITIQERRVEVASFQDENALNTWERSKNMFISTINFLLSASSRVIILLIGLSPIMIPFSLLIGGFFIWKRKKKQHKNEQSED